MAVTRSEGASDCGRNGAGLAPDVEDRPRPVMQHDDGGRLVFAPQFAGPNDLSIIGVDGSGVEEVLLDESFSEVNAQVSPDGRWLAYQSDESGRFEVYGRPFPNVDDGLQPVSSDGGSRPRWSADGTELFYYAEPNAIMTVPITSGDALTLGRPTVAVQGPMRDR